LALTPGTRLGVYEVTTQIGEGGMGQVYRAMDTTLGRQVAIKILPDAFASDPDRLARFEREAKTLASLNHPHIAAIYAVEKSAGIHALVMELVEGDDLSQRIARGAIPLDEVLPIAKQIAEALEAAHEQGIIHRDLKPANIKVRSDGTVKVLDFGLAKEIGGPAAPDSSHSPTLTFDLTQAGVLLGTVAYMSPEQARGRPVDRRTDIWAFGCVLYEVLTGRKVFVGDNASDSMVGIFTRDPDWQMLPPETPSAIRNLLRRCLQRDRDRRLQSIGDARIEIEEVLASAAGPASVQPAAMPPSRQPHGALRMVLPIVAVFVMTLAATWVFKPALQPAQRQVMRFPLQLPAGSGFLQGAISADGSHLVYSEVQTRLKLQLQLRSFDQFDAFPIAGSEFGRNPAFSPDGQWVLFTVGFGGGTHLMKLPIAGGKAVPSAETGDWDFSWAFDDTILYSEKSHAGIARVPSTGGTPQTLTRLDQQKGERGHWYPQLLPGGKALLLTVRMDGGPENDKVAVHALDTGQRRILLEGAQARYAPTGHVVFVKGGTLMAAPFDTTTAALPHRGLQAAGTKRPGRAGPARAAPHSGRNFPETLEIGGAAPARASSIAEMLLVPPPAWSRREAHVRRNPAARSSSRAGPSGLRHALEQDRARLAQRDLHSFLQASSIL